jgi:hypothetical protein
VCIPPEAFHYVAAGTLDDRICTSSAFTRLE